MKKCLYILSASIGLAACIFMFSSCFFRESTKVYESLFSLGEGMTYRTKKFKVERPTRTPFPVKVNDKYEYSIDTHGSHAEHCTEPVFDFAKPFAEELGAVKMGNKWGYIRLKPDNKGDFEFAKSPCFESAEPFSEGLAAVKQYGRYGYIDVKGNFVIEPKFISAHYFEGGIAAVEGYEGWLFINNKGEAVFNAIYECAESFTVSYTLKDGKYIADYDKTFAPVKIKGKWGYINLKGEVVIKPVFDDAWGFEFGRKAAVKLKNMWKYIDSEGKTIENIS